ncbi:uncharacterized protein LOC129778331 [Toxorhynchites rutilus septentrionalis]|uniref:uncharacterized protein LOC129778331 n=1 Tax=Toxorhynchites rutilus septentrionalis TaxID=329112 RepID=UPI0024798C45|nr:uncharacterized protein LOC129778331 [Toxorhynchites rutilus septentrionalis]
MDMKSPNIVSGEASETDEDEDDNHGKVVNIGTGPDAPPPISISSPSLPQRKLSLVFGEEAFDQTCLSAEDIQRIQLRRMINERCVSLLNEFIHTTASSVSRQLSETDNLLMKSQVVLQNTTMTVKRINYATDQVASRLQDIISSNFIPNINI